jgi:hypothetical protein
MLFSDTIFPPLTYARKDDQSLSQSALLLKLTHILPMMAEKISNNIFILDRGEEQRYGLGFDVDPIGFVLSGFLA